MHNSSNVHFHENEQGILIRCYHVCRHWLAPGFLAGYLVGQTLTFPLEHIQWDHIWPFYYVGDWLDRIGHLQMWIAYIWILTLIIAIALGIVHSARHKEN